MSATRQCCNFFTFRTMWGVKERLQIDVSVSEACPTSLWRQRWTTSWINGSFQGRRLAVCAPMALCVSLLLVSLSEPRDIVKAHCDRTQRKHASGGWYLVLIYLLSNRAQSSCSLLSDGPVHALQLLMAVKLQLPMLRTILPFVHMQKNENWSNTFCSDSKLFSVKDDAPFSVFLWGVERSNVWSHSSSYWQRVSLSADRCALWD